MELEEPFQAILRDFDGEYLYLETDRNRCIKVAIEDLRNIVPMG